MKGSLRVIQAISGRNACHEVNTDAIKTRINETTSQVINLPLSCSAGRSSSLTNARTAKGKWAKFNVEGAPKSTSTRLKKRAPSVRRTRCSARIRSAAGATNSTATRTVVDGPTTARETPTSISVNNSQNSAMKPNLVWDEGRLRAGSFASIRAVVTMSRRWRCGSHIFAPEPLHGLRLTTRSKDLAGATWLLPSSRVGCYRFRWRPSVKGSKAGVQVALA